MSEDIRCYTKILCDLSVLQRGSWESRIHTFYEIFGVGSDPNRIEIWSPTSVADVIGMREDGKTSRGKRVANIRSRLIREGILERVVAQDKRYSYRVTTRSRGLPDDALEIINNRTYSTIKYCRPDQIASIHAENGDLDRLPGIFIWYLNGIKRECHWHSLSNDALVDFHRDETWMFWMRDIPRKLNQKRHPLAHIEDYNLRLQMALSGVSRGIHRNITNAPSHRPWQPRNPYRWTLDALGRVGKRGEQDWEPLMDARAIRGAMNEHTKSSKSSSLRALAEEAARARETGGEDEED